MGAEPSEPSCPTERLSPLLKYGLIYIACLSPTPGQKFCTRPRSANAAYRNCGVEHKKVMKTQLGDGDLIMIIGKLAPPP